MMTKCVAIQFFFTFQSGSEFDDLLVLHSRTAWIRAALLWRIILRLSARELLLHWLETCRRTVICLGVSRCFCLVSRECWLPFRHLIMLILLPFWS